MSHRHHVVLLWRRLGPYHLARAEAASRWLRERGSHLVAIQLSDREPQHGWENGASDGLDVRTLKPGMVLEGSQTATGEVTRLLDDLHPLAVAVAGYDRPEMRAALAWARRNDATSILMSETKWDDKPRPWWRLALTRRIVRLCDAALVSGAPAGEYAVALGVPRHRVFRHYGAVGNDLFAAAADRVEESRSSPGQPYFLACGRFIEQRKSWSSLLHAYAQYRDARPAGAWGLVLCGDGPDRGRLEETVRELSIPDVRFTGFLQLGALTETYARAACFVHPAMNEAWGLVVNEAMAAGLPVLVSRRAGCAYDLVHEGVNGWTFDPHDTAGLTGLMTRVAGMARDDRRRLGAASRDIVHRFGPEQFARGLLEAIRASAGPGHPFSDAGTPLERS